jgi:hypothetical protein
MKAMAIFALGLGLRIAIIATNPVIWGGDTVIRMFDRYTLAKAHQLPGLQVFIAAVSRISMDPLAVQFLMAVIGAVAGVGFYLVARDLVGEKWAAAASLLFVTHPYILAVSTVPFQEILMLAGLLFAFHLAYIERWLFASLALAVACITRYEAWAACPVLAVAYCWRRNRTAMGAVQGAVLFGWMPVAWILSRHGLTSTGHFVLETVLSPVRLQRYAYLAWITVKFTQLPVLVLAGVAVWRFWRDPSRLDWRWRVQFAFVTLFAISIFFSAHGVLPDPERYVTSREAHIPMLFVLLLAVEGLTAVGRDARGAIAISAIWGIALAFWYVHHETRQTDVQLDYAVAKYLDRSVGARERALLLTGPLDESVLQMYFDKVRKTGGEEGLRQAHAEIAAISATPPDYQRVVVYSRLGLERLLAPPASCAEWVAVWNDYAGPAPRFEVRSVLRVGSATVTIGKSSCAAR